MFYYCPLSISISAKFRAFFYGHILNDMFKVEDPLTRFFEWIKYCTCALVILKHCICHVLNVGALDHLVFFDVVISFVPLWIFIIAYL